MQSKFSVLMVILDKIPLKTQKKKNAYKAITLYADEYNFDENDSVFILLLNAKW